MYHIRLSVPVLSAAKGRYRRTAPTPNPKGRQNLFPLQYLLAEANFGGRHGLYDFLEG